MALTVTPSRPTSGVQLYTYDNVALSGLQFARFANRHDAAEFIASPYFYMTEG